MSGQYVEFQRSIFMQPKLIHVDLNVLVSLREGCARLPDTGTLWSVIIVKIHTFAEVDQSILRGQSVREHLIDM